MQVVTDRNLPFLPFFFFSPSLLQGGLHQWLIEAPSCAHSRPQSGVDQTWSFSFFRYESPLPRIVVGEFNITRALYCQRPFYRDRPPPSSFFFLFFLNVERSEIPAYL